MAPFKERHASDDRLSGGFFHQHTKGKVAVGPILNAGKLKTLLLADGNSAKNCKTLDFSHNNIRKVTQGFVTNSQATLNRNWDQRRARSVL